MTASVEFKGVSVAVYRWPNPRRHPCFPRSGLIEYRPDPRRPITAVRIEQIGGGEDLKIEEIAAHYISPPVMRGEEMVGGGLCLPAVPFHYWIPYRPSSVEGRWVVLRLLDDQYEIEPGAIVVGMGGSLVSRHAIPCDVDRDPDRTQWSALAHLVDEYLLSRYDLQSTDLRGGFDFGCPSSPGDVYEAWIRSRRGEAVAWINPSRLPWSPEALALPDGLDRRSLRTADERVAALEELGYRARPVGEGDAALALRAATIALQQREGLVVDGAWGRVTERRVRKRLAG